MAFVIHLTKTKTVTLSFSQGFWRTRFARLTVLLLSCGVLLYTGWMLYSAVVIPVLAPQPLKPEEIQAVRSDIDRKTLNEILQNNEEKERRAAVGVVRDPFQQ